MEASGAEKPSGPPLSWGCSCVAGSLQPRTPQTRVSAVSARSPALRLLTAAYQGTRACLTCVWHGAACWHAAGPLAARRCPIGWSSFHELCVFEETLFQFPLGTKVLGADPPLNLKQKSSLSSVGAILWAPALSYFGRTDSLELSWPGVTGRVC